MTTVTRNNAVQRLYDGEFTSWEKSAQQQEPGTLKCPGIGLVTNLAERFEYTLCKYFLLENILTYWLTL